MDNLWGAIIAGVVALVGWLLVKNRGAGDDGVPRRPVDPLENAARREEIRRSEEARTREKLKVVDSRPNTSDAAADLEARLSGSNGTATTGDGHSPGGSPAPSDSTD